MTSGVGPLGSTALEEGVVGLADVSWTSIIRLRAIELKRASFIVSSTGGLVSGERVSGCQICCGLLGTRCAHALGLIRLRRVL